MFVFLHVKMQHMFPYGGNVILLLAGVTLVGFVRVCLFVFYQSLTPNIALDKFRARVVFRQTNAMRVAC
jgi:hypothetical protein